MQHLGIGPQSNLPSWNWIGFDLARELSKYFKVHVYQDTPPICDILIAVKLLSPQIQSMRATKIIYLPIDWYQSPEQIRRDASLLACCTAIGCHAEPLIPCFEPYCRRVFFIDHHAKYALSRPSPYKHQGFVLWVGAFENLPYLMKWLETRPIPLPLVILSNSQNPRSQEKGLLLADQLQVKVQLSDTHVNGHLLYPWSERTQRLLFREAKAAIDIKGGPWIGQDSWSQQMKSPAKGQQFVLSGVPFATNADCYTCEYFRQRGLDIAAPDNPSRWFSEQYWQETNSFAARFRAALSLENIGGVLKLAIESALIN